MKRCLRNLKSCTQILFQVTFIILLNAVLELPLSNHEMHIEKDSSKLDNID